MIAYNFDISKKVLNFSNKKNNLFDMHVHTEWCNHSENTFEYLKKLKEKNKLKFSVNEHTPIIKEFFKAEQVEKIFGKKEKKEFIAYLKRCAILKKDFIKFIKTAKNSELNVGFEFDYNNLFDNKNNYDYIISSCKNQNFSFNHISISIHFIDGLCLFKKNHILALIEKYGLENLIKKYFSIFKKAINSFNFDFVCHPGLIHYSLVLALEKEVMKDPKIRKVYCSEYKNFIDLCIEKNILIEVNTGGFRRFYIKDSKYDEHNPHMPMQILKYCVKKNAKLCIGSDFHRNKNYFKFFDQMYDFFVKLKLKKIYYIEKRNKKQIEII